MRKSANQNNYLNQGGWRIAASFLAWLLLTLGTYGSVMAADDAYLKALEAEAESSAHVQENATSGKPKVKSLQEEFEERLMADRPNTFTFYQKLSPEDKAAVLITYKESGRLPTAARKVLDLYFK